MQLGNASVEGLAAMRDSATVLAVRTGDGTWLYPGWQFTGRGEVHAVLTPVLAALQGLDGWVAGIWLCNQHPDLDRLSPRQALANGVDPNTIATLALHDKVALLS
jgi:hypothetical protein